MRGSHLKLLALCTALAWSGSAAAQASNDEDELVLSYGDRQLVSIATGSQQILARAPAVASVITARDIAAMGATDLDGVLESVAGMHVSRWGAPMNPLYTIRGIVSDYNAQVLVLINGQPITAAFIGNRGQAWGGLPLENVARIEVMRGPGSALYGADAFSGVINVITKTANDVHGLEYGLRVGSFHNRDAFLQWGGKLGELQAAFYLRSGATGNSGRIVEKDVQSTLDGIFGTHVSRAPGPVSDNRRGTDTHADLAYGPWRLRFTWQDRLVGMGVGLADGLDPDSRAPEIRMYTDLSYTQDNWIRHWDLAAVAGSYEFRNGAGRPAYQLFPPGAFGGAYPDGVIGNPSHFEHHHYLNVSALNTEFDAHRIRIGGGYRLEDIYRTGEFKNFNFVTIPGVGPALLPLGHVVDASNDPSLVYLQPHKRHVTYAFAQDEWVLAKDWTLTAGVRHDDYSDIGGTTNPRLALVWDASYNLIVKALHGRAFRPPNFTELYSKNNPVNIGNPNLKPETIATSELAFSYKPIDPLHLNLSLYRYRMRDIIVTVANTDPSTGRTFQNTGDQRGNGGELEIDWTLSRQLRLTGHWSQQHSIDVASGEDAGRAPRQHQFLRSDWDFAPDWQLGTLLNRVADRRRQPGDTRPPVPDYTTLDFSLRREKLAGKWELRAGLQNAFNCDVREPTVRPGNVPLDIPMPGRSVTVEFIHRL